LQFLCILALPPFSMQIPGDYAMLTNQISGRLQLCDEVVRESAALTATITPSATVQNKNCPEADPNSNQSQNCIIHIGSRQRFSSSPYIALCDASHSQRAGIVFFPYAPQPLWSASAAADCLRFLHWSKCQTREFGPNSFLPIITNISSPSFKPEQAR
jgi:hypothetical protein